jgi:hypothetical protein
MKVLRFSLPRSVSISVNSSWSMVKFTLVFIGVSSSYILYNKYTRNT